MRGAAHVAGKAHQAGGVGEVFDRGHAVVEADGVGQIADPALDRERLAHGVAPHHPHLAVRDVGEAEHHQDGRGLAGAVRPQQAERLAPQDVEIDAVDDDARAVALGEAPRGDDGLAHRRPNLATAPTISSSAAPMTPTPTMPQVVEVPTDMRNWVEAFSPREAARIVAM